MTSHYSALSLLREGLRDQSGWTKAWRSPKPKKAYDVVIIGGGGHGLATAYYLAKNHGVKNVAVIEKAGLAAAIPDAIQRLFGPTITIRPALPSMIYP